MVRLPMMEERSSIQLRNAPHRIRIGPAGWIYSAWQDQVYPKPKACEFDSLACLAQCFHTIEINRIPSATMTEI